MPSLFRESEGVRFLHWKKDDGEVRFREVFGKLKVHYEYGPLLINGESVKDIEWNVLCVSKYSHVGLDHTHSIVLAYPNTARKRSHHEFVCKHIAAYIEEFTAAGQAIIYETDCYKYGKKLHDITYEHSYTSWFLRCFDDELRSTIAVRALTAKIGLKGDDDSEASHKPSFEETVITMLFDSMDKRARDDQLQEIARVADRKPNWCYTDGRGNLKIKFGRVSYDAKKDVVLTVDSSRNIYERITAKNDQADPDNLDVH